MHELAEQAFRAGLKGAAGAEARAYLAKRGVGPAEIELFGLGLADRGRPLSPTCSKNMTFRPSRWSNRAW